MNCSLQAALLQLVGQEIPTQISKKLLPHSSLPSDIFSTFLEDKQHCNLQCNIHVQRTGESDQHTSSIDSNTDIRPITLTE